MSNVVPVFPLSGVLSLAVFTVQRSLHPLYGSAPTGKYLLSVVAASSAVTAIAPALSLTNSLWLISLVLASAPAAIYYTGVHSIDAWKDASRGVPATLSVVLLPLIYGSMGVIKHIVTPDLNGFAMAELVIAVVTNTVIVDSCVNSLWVNIPGLGNMEDEILLLALGAAALLSFASRAPWTRTQQLVDKTNKKGPSGKPGPAKATTTINIMPVIQLAVALAALGVSQILRPTLHPLHTPYTHPTEPVRILSSYRSVTGIVTVGETIPINYNLASKEADAAHAMLADARYLRVDHSLIGGLWIGSKVASLDGINPPSKDANGTRLGDTIYSTFVIQEAARLVKGTSPKKALTIGLGAGTSTQAFQKHGLDTTIVEIDPAVYQAARQYFGLADPGEDHVFLMDARNWVMGTQQNNTETDKPSKYDIVVHDCFSGGGIPGHIFTVEFWDALKTLINPDGILVVNFAGAPTSPSARAIHTTLDKIFGGCRVFHDYTREYTDEQLKQEFINLVFFCRASGGPVTFREPKTADYLNSHLREHLLKSFQKYEIPRAWIEKAVYTGQVPPEVKDEVKWVMTDDYNPLSNWQNEGAMHHWKVMQDVLPQLYWKTY